MYRDPVVTAVAVSILAPLSLLVLGTLGRRAQVLAPVVLAYLLRLTLGLGLLWTRGLSGDAQGYDDVALSIVHSWTGEGAAEGLYIGKEGWPYILATIYSAFGHSPEIGVIINSAAAALTVLVVARICALNGWSNAKSWASYIVALWPVGLFWGGLLLRESIVGLLVGTALLGVTRIRTGNSVLVGWMTLVLSGIALVPMRGGLSLVALAVMPSVLAVEFLLRRGTRTPIRLSGIASVSVMLIAAIPVLLNYFDSANYFDDSLREIRATALDEGASSFSAAGISHNGLTPYGMLLTGIGPLPWQVDGLALLAAFLDGILWLLVWLLAFSGAFLIRDRWAALYSLTPALLIVAYLAGQAANFGLLMRVRGVNIVLIAPLAAGAIHYWLGTGRRGRKTEAADPSLSSRSRAGSDHISTPSADAGRLD